MIAARPCNARQLDQRFSRSLSLRCPLVLAFLIFSNHDPSIPMRAAWATDRNLAHRSANNRYARIFIRQRGGEETRLSPARPPSQPRWNTIRPLQLDRRLLSFAKLLSRRRRGGGPGLRLADETKRISTPVSIVPPPWPISAGSLKRKPRRWPGFAINPLHDQHASAGSSAISNVASQRNAFTGHANAGA